MIATAMLKNDRDRLLRRLVGVMFSPAQNGRLIDGNNSVAQPCGKAATSLVNGVERLNPFRLDLEAGSEPICGKVGKARYTGNGN
jgi:hypothetical protein